MAEKLDVASARRKMKSPNIKTRKRALKALHEASRQTTKKQQYLTGSQGLGTSFFINENTRVYLKNDTMDKIN